MGVEKAARLGLVRQSNGESMRWLLIILATLVAFFTMPWWMPRAWYRALLYPGGRPNALSRRLNSAGAWFGSVGLGPSFMVRLETKGRRTGRIVGVPMVVAELGPDRYLVSMLGENADWVRNVRASGGEAVLCHGVIEQVRLEEISPSERAPILKAYLHRAPGARPHFDIAPDAPLEQFARVASRYPVFRVRPR
jgi:hypothetical protein